MGKSKKTEASTEMTPKEFAFLAVLLRSKEPIISAVRAVIFDGARNATAAHAVGISPQIIHRSTGRFMAMHKAICQAYKGKFD